MASDLWKLRSFNLWIIKFKVKENSGQVFSVAIVVLGINAWSCWNQILLPFCYDNHKPLYMRISFNFRNNRPRGYDKNISVSVKLYQFLILHGFRKQYYLKNWNKIKHLFFLGMKNDVSHFVTLEHSFE